MDEEISEQRRLLIGSYFLAEYSLESAALFNPSIVPAPRSNRTCRPALCGSFSACAPLGKDTFRPSRFELVSSIPIIGSRYSAPAGFLTEPRQIPNPRV